ncbi:MAG TPA: DNA recombination protein RmuC, partial [Terriglobia bacterium]|nr:DNA recombination protein RmuC [Terriglobia bacterium]
LRIPDLEQQILKRESERNDLLNQISQLRSGNKELETLLEAERQSMQEKLGLLQEATDKLSTAFKALSAEALKENNQSFLELAKATLETFQVEAKGDLEQRQKAVENLVVPIKETLTRYEEQIKAIEKVRGEHFGSLSEQVRQLLDSEQRLQKETANLVNALRTPSVRGRWGEFTLRRVVELAGMTAYCDFFEQESFKAEGGLLRPDLLVRLPGGRTIVVDSKAPLQAYLEALDAADEETRRLRLQTHARQIRSHLQSLSSKSYWEQLELTPEFVVMFIPGEPFYTAAVEQDPKIFEEGVLQRVILATPVSLIPLMLTIAYGWKQEQLAENAQKISELGKSLFDRLCTLGGHFSELGSSLGKSVDAYNRAVGSLENRVLVAARRFKELGVSAQEEATELPPIDVVPRKTLLTQVD